MDIINKVIWLVFIVLILFVVLKYVFPVLGAFSHLIVGILQMVGRPFSF